MTFTRVVKNFNLILYRFFLMADYHYHMIVDNPLILAFVLMCAIFIGLALLKRLIHT